MAKYKAPIQKPLRGNFTHGHSGYTNYGCRCPVCRAANCEYNLASRERRRMAMENGEVKPKHGTQSTYANYMCRCKRCIKANTEANTRQRAGRLERAKKTKR